MKNLLNPRGLPTRTLAMLAVMVLATLLTGCWPRSLYPFYTTADLREEPRLVGGWKQKPENNGSSDNEAMRWTFSAVDAKRFELLMSRGQETNAYEARVFELGGTRFLDAFSKIRNVDTIPAHHLFQLTEVAPTLQVRALNPDWIAKWLEKHPRSLAHVVAASPEESEARDPESIVLTAETRELQRFVRAHQHDPEFFAGAMVFEKEGAMPPRQP